MGKPNGQKVAILLEELLALGERGAEYDAHLIRIAEGDQFSTGFVELNPNSIIPVLLDTETGSRVFESGAILLYLAEKLGHLLSKDAAARTEVLTGSSGCRARLSIWAAGSAISMSTHPRNSNTLTNSEPIQKNRTTLFLYLTI